MKKTERIGCVNKNKQGYLMKVIEYNNANDITIEFQDDTKEIRKTNWDLFSKGAIKKTKNRVGEVKYDKHGVLMKCIEYIDYHNILVEFQDKEKRIVKATWGQFEKGNIKNPYVYDRVNKTSINIQGCLMKCIEYNNSSNVVIEFQDEFKYKTTTIWDCFISGKILNPYHPTVYNVGITGSKYIQSINGKHTKEYTTWYSMLQRCYSEKVKKKQPTYQNASCCKEWLLFDNFYDWLHSQSNFDVWKNIERSALDKDILCKGNKLYSPETCCLVPDYVNTLFVKNDATRGTNLIGVRYRNGMYTSQVNTKNGIVYLNAYETEQEAFNEYKAYKENLIKKIAKEEYRKKTISKKCYEAMINYKVEITD